jgi:uncharacterized protein DUF6611
VNETMQASRWRRLLDGGRSWGAIDVYPARYGVARYRLMVFPPGITQDERMLLRAWRTCRVWGAVLWLALEIVLVPTVGSGQALMISTGLCLAIGAAVLARTAEHRSQVRTMCVIRTAGYDDANAAERLTTLRELVEELVEADRMLAEGEASPPEHEAMVWRVYDRMSAVPA